MALEIVGHCEAHRPKAVLDCVLALLRCVHGVAKQWRHTHPIRVICVVYSVYSVGAVLWTLCWDIEEPDACSRILPMSADKMLSRIAGPKLYTT